MSWRGDLVARLRADPVLAGLLGTRIAFFEAARGWGEDYPQLVVQEVSPGRDYTHGGADGLDHPRLQFDIYATSGASIEQVEAALVGELEQDGVTQDGTRFGFAMMKGRRTLEPGDLGNQRRVQRLSLDFEFHHEAV